MRKTFLKRTADIFEKLAIGSMLVGLFQSQALGIFVGFVSLVASYIFTYLEAKE